MEAYYLTVTYVLTALLGLCVGSFLNVVIYRVPLGMSLSRPASHCPHCGYVLHAHDNIPVLSYLLLGGKCRQCRARISPRYTAVELANTLLWILCVLLFWQKSVALTCIYAVVCSVFLCIFFIDLAHKLIPDRFQLILLVAGIACIFLDKDYTPMSHVIGGVAGFAVLLLLGLLFERLHGEEALGGGDIKLVGTAGLILGAERLLLSLVLCCIPAAIVMLILRRRGRSDGAREGESFVEQNAVPFGPFLVCGFTVSLFLGKPLLDLYLSALGL